MEESFFDTPVYREFTQLDSQGSLPDERTVLRFRHRLKKCKLAALISATINDLLKAGAPVDATLTIAPASPKTRHATPR